MSEREYCHTHGKYDCQTCADEILSLGIQADKDRIAWLESENEALRKDAARYHYIRDMGLRKAGFKGTKILFDAQDEAIDAAIAGEKSHG